MRWLARFLVFFLAFSVEIKVRAAQALNLPTQNTITQQPSHCLQAQHDCAIRTDDGYKYVLKLDSGNLVLGSNTALVRTSGHSVHLLTGQILVQAKQDFQVESEYGQVTGSGEYMVVRRSHDVLVQVIQGEALLHLRGTSDVVSINPGQQNWLGAVSRSGISTSGIPATIPLEEFLQKYAALYTGDKPSFRREVLAFLTQWRAEVDQSANLQKQLLSRELASVEARKQKRAEIERQNAELNRKIRLLFRKKNYLDL